MQKGSDPGWILHLLGRGGYLIGMGDSKNVASVFMVLFMMMVVVSCATSGSDGSSRGVMASFGSWNGSVAVATKFGVVVGKKDERNTYAWLGVPYAAPPVGDLRWKAPQDPEPWQGVRSATKFGPKAVQAAALVGWTQGSEDSLYLNIWRPATTESNLPVYVWIHGGGNSSGSANASPSYRGFNLAANANVVFVSINYRLGLFGWFNHPALKTGTDPETDSGNFGTLDIIKALRWVNENIASFGGNPAMVTVGGESAGAFNILTLLMAPSARGLFQRAIVESGYRTTTTPAKAEAFANDIIKKLLIKERKAENDADAEKLLSSMPKAELARWLRSLSPRKLMSVIKAGNSGMLPFPYPIFDGQVLPAEGFAALADSSNIAVVPLIIGTNKEETKIFQWLGGQKSSDPLYQPLAELTSARWKADGADSIADALGSAVPDYPVYVYRFDWGAPDSTGKSVLPGKLGAMFGAFHSLEIPFFLGSDTVLGKAVPIKFFTNANEAGRTALQAQMGQYLANFIHTGNPNQAVNQAPNASSPSLPAWERWNAAEQSPAFMVFDASLTQSKTHLEYGRTTRASVRARLETEFQEPLKSRLLEAYSKE